MYDWRTFVTTRSLKSILADFGLALSGSKLVDSGKVGGNGKNILVQPFNVHLPNFRFQNKLLNAIDLDCGNEKIVLIGAGALGSHILNNCLREGYGNWTIIDPDYFWPHNVARHILTSEDIGYTKVESLKKISRTIQADSTVNAIAEDFFSGSDVVNNALGQADIILDVSTSIAVERCLALETKSNARKITCFLNPKGTATIMLLESSDGKARLDLLEMQYYRELVSNLIYVDHMALPETSVYSGSCRSITSRISQDNISSVLHYAVRLSKHILWKIQERS